MFTSLKKPTSLNSEGSNSKHFICKCSMYEMAFRVLSLFCLFLGYAVLRQASGKQGSSNAHKETSTGRGSETKRRLSFGGVAAVSPDQSPTVSRRKFMAKFLHSFNFFISINSLNKLQPCEKEKSSENLKRRASSPSCRIKYEWRRLGRRFLPKYIKVTVRKRLLDICQKNHCPNSNHLISRSTTLHLKSNR